MRIEKLRSHRRHPEGRHGEGSNEHRLVERHDKGKSGGAKTFRRGRAVAFLEHLETKRESLIKQLATPELQMLNPQIAGELKATVMIIDEFKKMFELQDAEATGSKIDE